MNISVREAPGTLSLTLQAPLPRTPKEWEPLSAAVNHVCAGHRPSDELVVELKGIAELDQTEIGGLLRCLASAARLGRIPGRVRLVPDWSVAPRRVVH